MRAGLGTWAAIAVLGAGALSCFSPEYTSGVTKCSPSSRCPGNWQCVSRGGEDVCVDPALTGGAGTTGTAGGGGGRGGNGGTAGRGGTTGVAGRGGTTGAAGTGGTTGAAGTGGTTALAGRGGTTGLAGTGGTTGLAGTGGTTGLAGRGGTTGLAGTGGTTGLAGRGGTTGTAGTSAGGTTGTAGIGGTGGAGGTAPRCRLTPDTSAWISAVSNDAKVQGPVYTYAGAGATIMPAPGTAFITAGDGRLCVKGSIARVTDGNFGLHYGAAMAFNLCHPVGAAQPTTLGTCLLGTNISGVRLRLTGPDVPPELRCQLGEPNRPEPAFTYLFPGVNVVDFASTRVHFNAAAPAVNLVQIESLGFMIPSSGNADIPFDFCIEEIEAINTATCRGTGGAGGGTPAPSFVYGFDTSTQGFTFNTYNNPTQTNLGLMTGAGAPTFEHDAGNGNPNNGALKVTVTFTNYNQYVDVGINLPSARNVSGRQLRGKLRLRAGSLLGGVMLHGSSGSSFSYASGPYISPIAGQWADLVLDARTVDPPWDATMLVEMGVQISTGYPPAGATFPGPTTLVFDIDTLSD